MSDSSQEIQGVGLYAEFRKNNGVSQLLVTPDGYSQAGIRTHLTTLHRVLEDGGLHPSWGITPSTPSEGGLDEYSDVEAYAIWRFQTSVTVLDQYISGGWAMVGEPILVEVSSKDLTDILSGHAPAKLLYRIGQCKIALGYPGEEVEL